MRFLFRYPEILLLTGAAAVTRFWHLSFPNWVVFDEAHFGLYAAKYLRGEYFFDIHPPLGKMLLAAAGWIGGATSEFSFSPGADYGDASFVALRFVPALLGVLLVPLAYFLVRELGFSRRAGFLAGFFVLFDNAILLQSRLMLLDIPLVFFIFLALLLYLKAAHTVPRSRSWFGWMAACSVATAAAISVKWVGFGVLGFLLLLTFAHTFLKTRSKADIGLHLLFLLLLPLLLYASLFPLRFALLQNSCEENCTPIEVSSAEAFTSAPPGDAGAQTLEYHKYMLFGNVIFQDNFYYQSDWYSWPFMLRPISYSQKALGEQTSFLLFVGNPLVWWLAGLAFLALLYGAFRQAFSKMRIPLFSREGMFVLLAGYAVFLLPFASVQRYSLLYHYLPSLIFGIMIAAVLLDALLSRVSGRRAGFLLAGVMLLIMLSFGYFAPLSYGTPLSEEAFHARMIFSIWNL